MINKNNELPSFVNETNLPNIVDKLTDAKNIKISNNKYGNRVQTVVNKIVEKADDVTKAIEQEVVNDSYSFKVGTGNVDVSADVEDGFGEVGVKGVTYQNLAPKGVALCDDASKFTHNYLHVTVTQQNGFVQCVTNQEGYCVLGYDNRHYNNLIQPNKCYITLAEVEIIKDTSNEGIYVAIPSYISYKEKKLQGEITKGVIAKAFKTNSDVTTNNNGWLAIRLTNNSTSVGDGFKCYYVSLFEISEAEFNNLSIDELIERYNYKCEGIVGVGDKSKNLFNKEDVKYGVSLNGNTGQETLNSNYVTSGFIKVNPSTSYITTGLPVVFAYDQSKNFIKQIVNNPSNLVAMTPSNCEYVRIRNYNILSTLTEQKQMCNITQLEKGSTPTEYQPYGTHKIEILSNGKNIFNTDLLKKNSAYMSNLFRNQFDFQGWAIISMSNEQVRKILKPNTTYTLSFKARMLQKMGTVQVYRYDVGMMFYHQDASPTHFGACKTDSITQVNDEEEMQVTFTTPGNLDKYELRVYSNRYAQGETIQTDIVRFFDMQIEENISKTSFEYYQQDKTQILLDEPLMRLPNGVHDEITRDGKLIKRVGKYTIDGSEGGTWYSKEELDYVRFWNGIFGTLLNPKLAIRTEIEMLCYTFPIYCNDSVLSTTNGHGISNTFYRDSIDKQIQIKLPKSSLTSLNSDGIKNWLKENPTTVYYELAEPIITELPAPCLRMFKDGHLTFNTLVAPESNHVVQLNKSAQIQNAIKESQSLDNRINVLENNYDNLMLSTISRLNDLELNYTLK